MTIRSDHELRALRGVGRIVGRVLRELESCVAPGVTTRELDAQCADLLAHHGVRSAPSLVYDFPGSICISVNDEAVHGVPGDREIAPGDLVKLDLVAERDGYFADAAISVAVPPVPRVARRLALAARRAFARALDVARAGRELGHVGRAIESEVRRNRLRVLPSLGGHGVGAAIHEEPSVPNFDDGSRVRLWEGLVLAIEPIVTAGGPAVVEDADGWTLRTRDGALSAHHEHTLVITRGRPILITTP